MSNILDFKVVEGVVISSSSSDFEVQALLGSGSFGEVAQCRKVATGETVAIKVLKNKDRIEEAKHEVTILTMLRRLHCDKFNIVTWHDSFYFKGRYCLEFEKLDINLYELLKKSRSLDLLEIRPIVQQLATALEFLGSAGIIHADLKPENIMLVDHVHQPLKIKVIDFGMATYRPAACTGLIIQTLWFRSPEVLLGAPISEAIDVWSLGCIAAELLMGKALFPYSVMLGKGLMGLPMEFCTGDGGDSDQEAVTSSNTTSSEDNSEAETDHSPEPSSFCRPITHESDSDTQSSQGKKRKRSSDGGSEGDHRSSNDTPAAKRSAVTGLQGRDCSKAQEECTCSTPGLSSSLKRRREDSTSEQTAAKRQRKH